MSKTTKQRTERAIRQLRTMTPENQAHVARIINSIAKAPALRPRSRKAGA